MNYEWIERNTKNEIENATCELKTTSKKANFCSNTVFWLYFKIRAQKFAAQNYWFFRSFSCFGVTKITTPI